MRAVQFSEFGGPEVLEIVEVPDPAPAPGQVRVRVHAAGINPIDWKMRRGGPMAGELPQRTGREAAGVVDELGEGVDDVAVGDKVFGFAAGGAAELVLMSDYAPIPPSLDFAHAAALPVAIETAVRGLDLLGVGDGTHGSDRRRRRWRRQRGGPVRDRARRPRDRDRQRTQPRLPALARCRTTDIRPGP